MRTFQSPAYRMQSTFTAGVQQVAQRFRQRFPQHVWFCSAMVAERAYERKHCAFIHRLGVSK